MSTWSLRVLLQSLRSALSALQVLAAATSAIFKSRAALQFENLALRHQPGVLHRAVKRPKLTAADRLFRAWKIRLGQSARPPVSKESRELIRGMSRENPLWGAPRIHGELLKLGIDIGETSVGKYMTRVRKPPSQTWRTFLENHVNTMVSVDFFTVPTIRFQVLYVFLVLAHDLKRIVHCNVTAPPPAEWTAQQPWESFPFDQIPRDLLRDRDRVFGSELRKCCRLRARPGN
ncbi:MAG: hypothetical protein NT154_46850, partial [Verrucomicrobia bacterium]|nr:hypothetical protein [Verrucomicrobiota bacterium]